MENRYYMVAILGWPVEDAVIARPWAEQGYDVVITTREYEDEGGDKEK
jgi:hypothetical protein